MARSGKNFFEFLTRGRFAKFLRQAEPIIDGSQSHLLESTRQTEGGALSSQGPEGLSIPMGLGLIDLFKQSEAALQQLRSIRHEYNNSDTETRGILIGKMKVHQSVYDDLQEKFRQKFLQVLASADLLDGIEIIKACPPSSIISSPSKASSQIADKEASSLVIDLVASDNAHQGHRAEHEDQDAILREWEAANEQLYQAIEDSKDRLMKIKEEADCYNQDETYLAKVHEYELSVENGDCTISRDDFDDNYASRCDELAREEVKAEAEFWMVIHKAEAHGMVVDAYIEGMQEEENPGSLYAESAIDLAAPQPHCETLTDFEKRMGRWLSPLIDPEELADVNQLEPIYPDDNLIDRDIVDSNAGVLFARPDTVDAPPQVVLARAPENR